MSYDYTKSRIVQWIGIILIIGLFAGAYWYFGVRASTLDAPNNALVSNGLVGVWSFNGDDISGTTVYDRSGSGNNGTTTGGPQKVDGMVGQALNFFPNGSDANAYVSMGDPVSGALDFGTGDFAVAFWMKGSGFVDQTSSTNTMVMKKNINSSPNAGYGIGYGSTNTVQLVIGNGTNEYYISASTATAGDNIWHHYIILRSGNTAYIYIDGVASGSGAISGSVSNSEVFTVGSASTNPNDRNAKATIDEVRAYNRALTANEIQALYDQRKGTKANTSISQPQGTGRLDSGLAGYWKLDDNSGSTAVDSSTNGNNGTLTNGPTWTAGQIGGAATFDGSNDYINIPDSNNLDPGTKSFSWSFWEKTNQDASALSYPGVISKEHDSSLSPRKGWSVEYGTTNHMACTLWYNDVSDQVASSAALNDNTWHHITCVRNVPANTLQIFVDGVLNSSVSLTYTGSNDISNALLLEIGGRNFSTFSNKMFAGSMDEVRIYDRALSLDEVSQLYRLTTPTYVDTGLKGYWSFNGKDMSGTTAFDRSGAGNTGTLNNSPPVADGKIGQALSFASASSQYVGLGNATNLQLSTGTLSAWAKSTAICSNSQANYCAILVKANAYGLFQYVHNLAIYDWGASAVRDTGIAIDDGQWHLFTTTFQSGVANGTVIYMDGVAVMTTTMTVSVQSNALEISRGGASQPLQLFNGSIDEARVYSRILSAGEIKGLYDAGASDKVNSSVSQNQGTGRLDSGLAGYWPLDNGSGTSATDLSTNGNTGTLTNGPTWGTGQIGGDVVFDGTNDYIDVGSSSTLAVPSTPNFSVSIWAKKTVGSATGMTLVNRGTNGVGGWNVAIGSNCGGTHQINVSKYARTHLCAGSFPQDTNWHQVTTVWGSSAVDVYIDGALSGSVSDSNTIASISTSFLIGANSGGTIPFNGSLDEARFYNRTLSADEVSQLYRLTSPTGTDTSLKGYWSFNGKDLSGTTAYDRSGSGNNGTLTNGPAVADGKIGQGLSFDGSNDYVDVPYANLNFERTDPFSFSAWEKLNLSAQSGTWAGFLGKSNGSTTGIYLGACRVATAGICSVGSIAVLLSGTVGGQGIGISTAANSFPSDVWNHIVATYDGSSNASGVKIYLNGVNMSLTTHTNTLASSIKVPVNWRIGDDYTSDYVKGNMDEVRIYNRVLSAAEVAALYNQGR